MSAQDDRNDRLYSDLNRESNRLAEQFDCVQILASKVEPDGSTTTMFSGSGNWHGRIGMCRSFVEHNTARVAASYHND